MFANLEFRFANDEVIFDYFLYYLLPFTFFVSIFQTIVNFGSKRDNLVLLSPF